MSYPSVPMSGPLEGDLQKRSSHPNPPIPKRSAPPSRTLSTTSTATAPKYTSPTTSQYDGSVRTPPSSSMRVGTDAPSVPPPSSGSSEPLGSGVVGAGTDSLPLKPLSTTPTVVPPEMVIPSPTISPQTPNNSKTSAAPSASPTSSPTRSASPKSRTPGPIVPMPFTKRKTGKFTRKKCLEAASMKSKQGGIVGSVKSIYIPTPKSIYDRKPGTSADADEETESEEEADHLFGGFGTCITTMRDKVSRLRGMEGLFFMKIVSQAHTVTITDPLTLQFGKQKGYKMLYVRLINSTRPVETGCPTIRTYSPFGARVRGPTMYGGKKPPRGSMAAPASPLSHCVNSPVASQTPSPVRNNAAAHVAQPNKAPAHVAFKTPTSSPQRGGVASSPPASNKTAAAPPPINSAGILEIYDAEVDMDAGEFMILDKLVSVPLNSINDVKRSALEQKDAMLMPSEELGCEYKYGQLLLHLTFTLPLPKASPPSPNSPNNTNSGGKSTAEVVPSSKRKPPEFEVDIITNCAYERDLWYDWISKFILHADMVDLHTDTQQSILQFRARKPVVGVRDHIKHFLRGAKKKPGGADQKSSSAGSLPKPPGDGLVVVYCEDVLVKRRLGCMRMGEVILSSLDNFSHVQKVVLPLRNARIWVKNTFSNEMYLSFTSATADAIDLQQNRAGMTTVDMTDEDAIELKATNPYDRDVLVEWFLKVKGGPPQARLVTYPYEGGNDEFRFLFHSVSPKRRRRKRRPTPGDDASSGASPNDQVSGSESGTSSGAETEEHGNTGSDDDVFMRSASSSKTYRRKTSHVIAKDGGGREQGGDEGSGGLWTPLNVSPSGLSPTKRVSSSRTVSSKSKGQLPSTRSGGHGSFMSNESVLLDVALPVSADPRPLLDRKRLGRSASFIDPSMLTQSITGGAKVLDAAKEVRIRRRLSIVCQNRNFMKLDNPVAATASTRRPSELSSHTPLTIGGKAIDISPLDAVDLLIHPIMIHGKVQYGEIGAVVPLPTPTTPYFPNRVTTLDFAGEKLYVLEGAVGSTVVVELPVSLISCVTVYSSVFGSSGITLHCLGECIEVCVLFDLPTQRQRLLFALHALGVVCHSDKSREDINRAFMEDNARDRAILDAKQGIDVAENTAMMYPCGLCGKQSYVCDATHQVHPEAVQRLNNIDLEQRAGMKRALFANFEADFASSDDENNSYKSNNMQTRAHQAPPQLSRSYPSVGEWLLSSLPQLEVPNPRTVSDLNATIARSKAAIRQMERAMVAVGGV